MNPFATKPTFRQIRDFYQQRPEEFANLSLDKYSQAMNNVFATDSFDAASNPFGNAVKSASAGLDDWLNSTPVVDAAGDLGETIGGWMGSPEAGRAAGEGLPRGLTNMAPMMTGRGIGTVVGGGLAAFAGPEAILPGAQLGGTVGQWLGLLGTGAMAGAQTYEQTDDPKQSAVVGGLSAAVPFIMEGGGAVASNLAAPIVKNSKLGDNLMRYIGGQLAVSGAFTASDVAFQGPEILQSKDYWVGQTVGQLPFLIGDLATIPFGTSPLRPKMDPNYKTPWERQQEGLPSPEEERLADKVEVARDNAVKTKLTKDLGEVEMDRTVEEADAETEELNAIADAARSAQPIKVGEKTFDFEQVQTSELGEVSVFQLNVLRSNIESRIKEIQDLPQQVEMKRRLDLQYKAAVDKINSRIADEQRGQTTLGESFGSFAERVYQEFNLLPNKEVQPELSRLYDELTEEARTTDQQIDFGDKRFQALYELLGGKPVQFTEAQQFQINGQYYPDTAEGFIEMVNELGLPPAWGVRTEASKRAEALLDRWEKAKKASKGIVEELQPAVNEELEGTTTDVNTAETASEETGPPSIVVKDGKFTPFFHPISPRIAKMLEESKTSIAQSKVLTDVLDSQTKALSTDFADAATEVLTEANKLRVEVGQDPHSDEEIQGVLDGFVNDGHSVDDALEKTFNHFVGKTQVDIADSAKNDSSYDGLPFLGYKETYTDKDLQTKPEKSKFKTSLKRDYRHLMELRSVYDLKPPTNMEGEKEFLKLAASDPSKARKKLFAWRDGFYAQLRGKGLKPVDNLTQIAVQAALKRKSGNYPIKNVVNVEHANPASIEAFMFGAAYDRRSQQILVSVEKLSHIFENQLWTKPAPLEANGATIRPIPLEALNNIDRFVDFVLIHENAHNYIFKRPSETKVAYEQRVVDHALEALGLQAEPRTAELVAIKLEADARFPKKRVVESEAFARNKNEGIDELVARKGAVIPKHKELAGYNTLQEVKDHIRREVSIANYKMRKAKTEKEKVAARKQLERAYDIRKSLAKNLIAALETHPHLEGVISAHLTTARGGLGVTQFRPSANEAQIRRGKYKAIQGVPPETELSLVRPGWQIKNASKGFDVLLPAEGEINFNNPRNKKLLETKGELFPGLKAAYEESLKTPAKKHPDVFSLDDIERNFGPAIPKPITKTEEALNRFLGVIDFAGRNREHIPQVHAALVKYLTQNLRNLELNARKIRTPEIRETYASYGERVIKKALEIAERQMSLEGEKAPAKVLKGEVRDLSKQHWLSPWAQDELVDQLEQVGKAEGFGFKDNLSRSGKIDIKSRRSLSGFLMGSVQKVAGKGFKSPEVEFWVWRGNSEKAIKNRGGEVAKRQKGNVFDPLVRSLQITDYALRQHPRYAQNFFREHVGANKGMLVTGKRDAIAALKAVKADQRVIDYVDKVYTEAIQWYSQMDVEKRYAAVGKRIPHMNEEYADSKENVETFTTPQAEEVKPVTETPKAGTKKRAEVDEAADMFDYTAETVEPWMLERAKERSIEDSRKYAKSNPTKLALAKRRVAKYFEDWDMRYEQLMEHEHGLEQYVDYVMRTIGWHTKYESSDAFALQLELVRKKVGELLYGEDGLKMTWDAVLQSVEARGQTRAEVPTLEDVEQPSVRQAVEVEALRGRFQKLDKLLTDALNGNIELYGKALDRVFEEHKALREQLKTVESGEEQGKRLAQESRIEDGEKVEQKPEVVVEKAKTSLTEQFGDKLFDDSTTYDGNLWKARQRVIGKFKETGLFSDDVKTYSELRDQYLKFDEGDREDLLASLPEALADQVQKDLLAQSSTVQQTKGFEQWKTENPQAEDVTQEQWVQTQEENNPQEVVSESEVVTPENFNQEERAVWNMLKIEFDGEPVNIKLVRNSKSQAFGRLNKDGLELFVGPEHVNFRNVREVLYEEFGHIVDSVSKFVDDPKTKQEYQDILASVPNDARIAIIEHVSKTYAPDRRAAETNARLFAESVKDMLARLNSKQNLSWWQKVKLWFKNAYQRAFGLAPKNLDEAILRHLNYARGFFVKDLAGSERLATVLKDVEFYESRIAPERLDVSGLSDEQKSLLLGLYSSDDSSILPVIDPEYHAALKQARKTNHYEDYEVIDTILSNRMKEFGLIQAPMKSETKDVVEKLLPALQEKFQAQFGREFQQLSISEFAELLPENIRPEMEFTSELELSKYQIVNNTQVNIGANWGYTLEGAIKKSLQRNGYGRFAAEQVLPKIKQIYELFGAPNVRFGVTQDADKLGFAAPLNENMLGVALNADLMRTAPSKMAPRVVAHELTHVTEFLAAAKQLPKEAQAAWDKFIEWTNTASKEDIKSVMDVFYELADGDTVLAQTRQTKKFIRNYAFSNPLEVRAHIGEMWALSMMGGKVTELGHERALTFVPKTVTDWIQNLNQSHIDFARVLDEVDVELQGSYKGFKLAFDAFTSLQKNVAEAQQIQESYERMLRIGDPKIDFQNLFKEVGSYTAKLKTTPFAYALKEEAKAYRSSPHLGGFPISDASGEKVDNGVLARRTASLMMERMENIAWAYPETRPIFSSVLDFQTGVAADSTENLAPLVGGRDAATGKFNAKPGDKTFDDFARVRDNPKVNQAYSLFAKELQGQQRTLRGEDLGNTPAGRAFRELNASDRELVNKMVEKTLESVKMTHGHVVAKLKEENVNLIATYLGRKLQGRMKHAAFKELAQGVVDSVDILLDPTLQQGNMDMVNLSQVKAQFDAMEAGDIYQKVMKYATQVMRSRAEVKQFFDQNPNFITTGLFGRELQWNARDLYKRMNKSWGGILERLDRERATFIDGLDIEDTMKEDLKHRFDTMSEIERFATELKIGKKAENLQGALDDGREASQGVDDIFAAHMMYVKLLTGISNSRVLESSLNYAFAAPELQTGKLRTMADQMKQMVSNFKHSDTKIGLELNKMFFQYFMGLNLSSHVMESMQPYFSFLPHIITQGDMNPVKATMFMHDAMGKVGKFLAKSAMNKKYDNAHWEEVFPGEKGKLMRDLFDQAAADKLVSMTYTAEMLGEPADIVGQNVKRATTGKKTFLKTAGEAAGTMVSRLRNMSKDLYSHFTMHNARTAMLIGWEVAVKKFPTEPVYVRNPNKAGAQMLNPKLYKEARDLAAMMTFSTGRFGRPAAPFATRDPITRTAGMMFYALQSYNSGMLGLHGRLTDQWLNPKNYPGLTPAQRRRAAQAEMTLLGVAFGSAGLLGLPFVGTGLALLEQNTELEPNKALRESVARLFNEDEGEGGFFSELATRGAINALLGQTGFQPDIGSRLSLGSIFGADAYNGFTASALFGPTFSLVEDVVKSAGHFSTGDWRKGLKDVLPIAMRKSIGMVMDGGDIVDMSGTKLIDATPGDRLANAIGFSPQKLTRLREGSRILRRTQEIQQLQDARWHDGLAHMWENEPEKVRQMLLERAANSEGGYDAAMGARKVAERVVKRKFPKDVRLESTASSSPKEDEFLKTMDFSGLEPSMEARKMQELQVMQILGFPVGGAQASLRESRAIDDLIRQKPWLSYSSAKRILSQGANPFADGQ
jgi:hypothetical protein